MSHFWHTYRINKRDKSPEHAMYSNTVFIGINHIATHELNISGFVPM